MLLRETTLTIKRCLKMYRQPAMCCTGGKLKLIAGGGGGGVKEGVDDVVGSQWKRSLYNFRGGGFLGDPCATAITLSEVGREISRRSH